MTFPSPSRDFYEQPLSLDKYLVDNPVATFFVKYKDSLLVVDRSKEPERNKPIIATSNNSFKLCNYPNVPEGAEFWGKVVAVVRKL